MLNIVIPMAGRGSRFQEQGYTVPKPLIDIHGQPMIRLVIHNLSVASQHRFIFLCLKEHLERFDVKRQLCRWAKGCEILTVDQITEGAACTVLLAKAFINNDHPLMIANSDQWVDADMDDYIARARADVNAGMIMTMTADDPKWSYVRLNAQGAIVEVVEKQVVSNEATVGIYNFKKGSDFVRAAERMIARNFRVNNEFYVAPVYNEMIADGQHIGYYNIGKEADGMYGLGKPDDLEYFKQLPLSKEIAAAMQ